MRQFTTVAGLRCYLEQYGLGKQIGFVPTMGALHPGHLSLIERASQENDLVVVSIFVNPLQFSPGEDFERYPRPVEQDRNLCQQAGVDVLFVPTPEEMYAPGETTQVVPPSSMTDRLCGRSRPGHFQGVATVVVKLLNLVQPQRAYFGQKDGQQVAIVRRLVADLHLPVEVISCPTYREPSGLATSSRNRYLMPEQRQSAAVLHRSLQQARTRFLQGECRATALVQLVEQALQQESDVEVEYVELVHLHTLEPLEQVEEAGMLAIAARVGSARLIDNEILHNRKPIVAIDGPAGAGKSTVTRLVAQKLGLFYLDTGAMYRAITWLVLQSGIALDDRPAIAELVSQCQLHVEGTPNAIQVAINGRDVTQVIRSERVTANVSTIAAQKAVREFLLERQQFHGRKGGLVAEGRDIGTHVFPDAEVKIYLNASVQERARRRQQDLLRSGEALVSLAELEAAIALRDRKDSTRALAPLTKASDALEIFTDSLSITEVVDRIVSYYREKCPLALQELEVQEVGARE